MATGPNSIATLTEASSMAMVGGSASWRIGGSGDAVSVGGDFDMVILSGDGSGTYFPLVAEYLNLKWTKEGQKEGKGESWK
eukprot:scaffold76746_cov67-Attheya_sp.AAC.2